LAGGLDADFIGLAYDLLALGDVAAVGASGVASALIWSLIAGISLGTSVSLMHLWSQFGGRIATTALVAPFVLRSAHTSRGRDLRNRDSIAQDLPRRLCVFGILMLSIGVATHSLTEVPAALLLLWTALGSGAVWANRLMLASRLDRMERSGTLGDVIAIVGAGELTDRLIEHLRQSKARGLQIAGVFDDRRTRHQSAAHLPYGTLADLLEIGKRQRIDWVLITFPQAADARLRGVAHRLKALATSIAVCPQHFAVGAEVPCQEWTTISDVVHAALLVDRPLRGWDTVIKRLEDLLLGGTLFLLALPLMVLIALAIRIDSPGPVLFRQPRHGWNNREFEVIKFRTMRASEHCGDAVQTARGDERITRVGRLLRRMSLDELPQIWNVLRGDMSLVGPRPHAVDMRTEDLLGHEIVEEYPHRHRVRPGLTGWAQVHGSRGATETAEQVRERVEFDLYYTENWSVTLDLKILLRTLLIVIRGQNAF
jgi:Undecaprenyl-phosphate glucose phosphotransferase